MNEFSRSVAWLTIAIVQLPSDSPVPLGTGTDAPADTLNAQKVPVVVTSIHKLPMRRERRI